MLRKGENIEWSKSKREAVHASDSRAGVEGGLRPGNFSTDLDAKHGTRI